MGKKLIIKGADFSTKGIPSDNNVLFSQLNNELLVRIGIISNTNGFVKGGNDARCCIYNFSLSDYNLDGYNHLKLNVNQTANISIILAIGSIGDHVLYDGQGNISTWKWNNVNSIEGNFYGDNNLFINFKYNNDSDFPIDTKFENLISSVELSKVINE